MNDEIYYRIYFRPDFRIEIVCIRWYDEYDYNRSRFYSEAGEPLKFSSAIEAKHFLDNKIVPGRLAQINSDIRKLEAERLQLSFLCNHQWEIKERYLDGVPEKEFRNNDDMDGVGGFSRIRESFKRECKVCGTTRHDLK